MFTNIKLDKFMIGLYKNVEFQMLLSERWENMQNEDKQKLKSQLEQEAKILVSIDGDDLNKSLLSTSYALLKMAEQSIGKSIISDEISAIYFAFANRVIAFYRSYMNQHDSSDAENAKELQELKDKVQKLQETKEDQERQLAICKHENKELSEIVDANRKELDEQQGINESLNRMLSDSSEDKIEEQKKRNDELLARLNTQKKTLIDLSSQYEGLAKEKEEVERNLTDKKEKIEKIPQELVDLRTEYKELEVVLNELNDAESLFSEEKQAELQKKIDELTPIVEKNKVAAEILENRKNSLENQKLDYDEKRQILTTELIDVITSSICQLRTVMEKYTEFLDDTEATARTLADNYIACKKKRDMYEHWFDVDKTPLEAMMEEIGHPENIELRKTLNVNQVQTVKSAFEDIQSELSSLDHILAICQEAERKDLQVIRRKAGN